MTSLNSLNNTFQVVRPGQPVIQRNAQAPAANAQPGDVLGLTTAAADPGLTSALGGMDRAIASKTQALQAIDRELASGTSQVRMIQLQAQRDDVAKALRVDRGLQNLGRQLAANPAASAADADQMAQMLREAARTTDGARRGTLQVTAEDLVRNAGRQPASDRGLYNATLGLQDRLGQLDDNTKALTQELGQTNDQRRIVQIQAQLADDAAKRGQLTHLKHQADRLANNPQASAADAEQMSQLMAEASQTTDPKRQAQIALQAEDIARNSGRDPKSDRGLYNATVGMVDRMGDIQDHRAALTQELVNTTDQARMTQIQLQLADDDRQLQQLQGLKRQADRLADNPGAGGEDADRMSALMQEAGQTTDPRRLAQIQVQAGDIARNAGRTVPTDRGVANGLSALATRDGDLQDQMKALAMEANAGSDPRRLTQIQLELDDLQRTRDQLQVLQKAAEHAADRGDMSPASSERLANLMAEASQTNDIARLYTIGQEARTLR